MAGHFGDLVNAGVEFFAEAGYVGIEEAADDHGNGLPFFNAAGLEIFDLFRGDLADAGFVAHHGFGMLGADAGGGFDETLFARVEDHTGAVDMGAAAVAAGKETGLGNLSAGTDGAVGQFGAGVFPIQVNFPAAEDMRSG